MLLPYLGARRFVFFYLVARRGPTYQKEFKALLSLAQRGEAVSVVPTHSQIRLSPRVQAPLMTSVQLSGVQWPKLRRALGGKDSGLMSRELMRAEQQAVTQQPGKQAVANELGARLVSLRGALECLLGELVRCGLFVERHVCGADGSSVPHTLHTLAHHALAFLRRYGSLRTYGEQALEAWHGYCNQAGARLTADSLLGRCLALVQQASNACAPSSEAALARGQHRRQAAPGARCAVKPGDKRLRGNKTHRRATTAGDARALQQMEQWAADRVSSAETTVNSRKKNVEQPGAPDPPGKAPEPSLDEEFLEEELDPVALFVLDAPTSVE